jgi:hypothetical protein
MPKVKNDITFNNHTLNLNQQAKHGIHELAIVLSTVDDQVFYPTITIHGSQLFDSIQSNPI